MMTVPIYRRDCHTVNSINNCRMVKGGWTKNTKVAAVRLDVPVDERLIEAARREGLNLNDYLKAMVQERLTAESEL